MFSVKIEAKFIHQSYTGEEGLDTFVGFHGFVKTGNSAGSTKIITTNLSSRFADLAIRKLQPFVDLYFLNIKIHISWLLKDLRMVYT